MKPDRITLALAALMLIAGGLIGWSQGNRGVAPVELRVEATLPDLVPRADNPLISNPFSHPVENRLQFARRAESSGVRFEYYGGPSTERDMTEQNGGGVAILDYDRDGWPDLFYLNGSRFTKPAEEVGARSQLYRARGDWRYQPVGEPAGVAISGFGMGLAAGDFDNDGFPDLFGCFYGADHLWHNNGDGTFTDITATTGCTDDFWSTSAAWSDLDGDGDLDLFVANYVVWKPTDPPCYSPHQPQRIRISCGPLGRDGTPSRLYENLGDGQFRDASRSSGIASVLGKSLDLAAADLDGDGRLDLYVANDTTPKSLFRNQGQLQFIDEGIPSGSGMNRDGLASSGMGIGLADCDRDGRFDLFVTNFENEANDLYFNSGTGAFEAGNTQAGLDVDSRPMLGFGTAMTDFDLDGWPDLFVANGHIWDFRPLGLGHRYTMPPLLYRNRGDGFFLPAGANAGEYFRAEWIARAVAMGDLDRDGDTDLAVTHLESPHELLENRSTSASPGQILRWIGTRSAREPRGATVRIRAGEQSLTLWIPSGGGYQASSEETLCVPTFGQPQLDAVELTWPNGQTERWTNISLSASVRTLIEGTGEQIPRPNSPAP